MDEERTFGIEMELTSTKSRDQLAEIISQAFRENGSNHDCVSTSYVRNTDGRNARIWTIKTDGSIRINPDHPQFSYGAEIVSPVLKGEDGLAQLKIVCAAILPYVKVNKSCGLHVHHGMKPEDNLGNILMAWVRAERVIYQCLPVSRRIGSYARPIAGIIGDDTPPSGTMANRSEFRNWIDRKTNSRYWGMNLQSLWLRGTIEIRCAAGTYEYKKIANWVRVTQRLIVKGSLAPDSFAGISNITDLTGVLKTGLDLPERTELVQQAVESVRAGQLHNLPRRNTGRGTAFYYLLENGPVRYSDAVDYLCSSLNCNRNQADGYISRAMRVLAPQTGAVASGAYGRRRWSGQTINISYPRLVDTSHNQQEVIHPAVNLPEASDADRDALSWLQERHEIFSARS